MIELALKIKYTTPDGWVAWLQTEHDWRVLWTPLRGFYPTPQEAAERAVLDFPDFLNSLQEAENEDA